MDLLREYLTKERAEILDNNIRLNAIGELDKLPKYVREPLEALRLDSRHHDGMVLTLALSYGGREELVAMVRQVAARASTGALQPGSVSEDLVNDLLWTKGLPPVDLIVRTSGEYRLSNFLLWQSAYAELVFTDALWPEFRSENLVSAVEEFQKRERRFGMTSAQLQSDTEPNPSRAGT
jgi:undecaprenyl diphosphate synthase